MSLADDELLVRRFLGLDRITPCMPATGRVVPAPVYFNDKEDYWATIESVALTTQNELETEHIVFCSFYFKNFTYLGGPKDSPIIGLNYELYVFSQYDLERADESNVSPDAFNKKMLAKHNEFVKLVLDLQEILVGERDMGILDTNIYSMQKTTSLVENEFVQNKAQCEFIPGVLGHSAKFQETVKVQKIAC